MKKDDLILAIALVIFSIGVYSTFHPEKFDFSKLNIPFLSQLEPDNKVQTAPQKESALDWSDYMKDVETKIKSNWHPPKSEASSRIMTSFKIGRKGQLVNYKITVPSPDPTANQRAIEALVNSAPFSPLPDEYHSDTVTIEFAFDYNIIND